MIYINPRILPNIYTRYTQIYKQKYIQKYIQIAAGGKRHRREKLSIY